MNMMSATDEIEKFGLRTMVDVVRYRARCQANETAFIFLRDGELDEQRMTYADLDRRARAVAGALMVHAGAHQSGVHHVDALEAGAGALRGARVLLLYPPGLDYIGAFFGCLYAGAIAVPAYPPEAGRVARTLPRVQAIVADCDARLALTSGDVNELMAMLEQHAPDMARMICLSPDQSTLLTTDIEFEPAPEQLAFLQYTSGSTATPKGVMVSHGNLMANQKMLVQTVGTSRNSVGVGWLPLYHDMGLIGQLMNPLYCGYPVTLMSPLHFLQSPLRWLRAISRYRATVTSAPNFAYDLCVQKYERAVAAGRAPELDLRSWSAALNGAEPVRAETLDAFSSCFASVGFRPQAWLPCYGLAEATLMVSGRSDFVARDVATEAARERVTLSEVAAPLVGCGSSVVDQTLRIVDPETRRLVPEGAIGEIWVAGPHVARGYWNRAEQSAEVFRARIDGYEDGPFLRTGDLGLLRGGTLYVAGRRKDLIIVRGRNVYPQDIEFTVEKSHRSVREGGVAAFAVSPSGEEELAIAVEVRATSEEERSDIVEAIRRAVLQQHDLDAAGIELLRPGTLSKTSSGKIQRHAARKAYLDGTSGAHVRWSADRVGDTKSFESPKPRPSRAAIEAFLVSALSELCKRPAHTFDPQLPFASFGVDSRRAVALSGALEEFIGERVNPTAAYEHPSIARLAAHLAGESVPERSESVRTPPAEPIAIVGLACRFPGAEDQQRLWELLSAGKHAVRDVPQQRCALERVYSADGGPGKTYTRRAALMESVDHFDPEFFGISRSEARAMDPLQRILLEVTWEALCDAGQPPDALSGSATGVFIGASNNEYAALRVRSQNTRPDGYSATGSLTSTLAGRLSYTLGLSGPSMVVDTACSSSLLAVHLACQSLRSRECEMALAGGANLILLPESFVALSAAGALSHDGHCRPFDAKAGGYGRGEGCGVIVLKRLSDALAAGEPVLAVIHGSAVNQDGRSNGLTAPSSSAQSQVIRAALANAGVRASDVDYVEAHGTGTKLGDPIEAHALNDVYGVERTTGAPLWLGSVKASIGHLEAAAGIAGLIKATLVLRHGVVPAQPDWGEPSALIRWHELKLRVPTGLTSLPAHPSRARLAAVSAFGMTGTNVHLVLGEAPQASVDNDRKLPVLRLGAKSSAALQALAKRLAAHVRATPELAYEDFVAAVNLGQAELPHRASIVASSREALLRALDDVDAQVASTSTELVVRHVERGTTSLPAVFLFTGQGAQYPDMGRQLFETQPVFRRCLLECERLLEPWLDRPLLAIMHPRNDADRQLLEQTKYAQPALFALEYALVELLRSCGVVPDVVTGHSLGELVAAAVAGVMSLEDGLRLAAVRGALTQQLAAPGAMLAVSADAEVLTRLLEDCPDLTLAAVNAPGRVTLSGPPTAIDDAQSLLAASAIAARRLTGTRAFHSAMMAPVVDAFRREVAQVQLKLPTCRVVSALTGREEREVLLQADYWSAQLRNPVRFDLALAAASEKPVGAWIEIGPRAVLLPFVRLHQPSSHALRIPTLHPDVADAARVAQTLGTLYAHGVSLDWTAVSGRPTRHVFVPAYPWQRERCWFEAADSASDHDVVRRAPPAANVAKAQVDMRERQSITERLRRLVATLLECQPSSVGLRTPLVDLGADSILLIEGVQRIDREFGVRLSHEDVFQRYSTIELLAAHLADVGQDALASSSAGAQASVSDLRAIVLAPASVGADAALADSMLTAQQQAHLQAFAQEYQARTRGSKARQISAKPQLVDTRASVGFRTAFPDALRARWLHTKEIAYPIVAERSRGSKIWDVDGNEYVDLAMGFGVHLFGHSPDFLVDALHRQLDRGMQIGPQAELAEQAASLISELTGVARVAFCSSGTEAVMTAMRVARGATRRPKIAVFAGSYHGSFDGVLGAIPLTLGSPPGIEHDVVVLEYGATSALEILSERAEEFAAVLVEPVQGRRPEFQPREFLQQLRTLTRERGIALIFDEVLVGFRIHMGGAQAWFGIEADIVTYGKIAGGGMPIGVISGRAEFMDVIDGGTWQYGDASTPRVEQIWFAGTFNKNPMTMAAAVAALSHLKASGPELQATLNKRTDTFVGELNRFFETTSTQIQVSHFGSLLRFRVPRHLELFYHHLIARGVYIWEGRSSFLSTAHTDADLTHVVDAVRGATRDLEQGGFVAPAAAPRTSHVGARSQPEPLRVFCFPDAGGTANHYKRWARLLPDHVELELVQIPGRDDQGSEPQSFAELTRRVAEGMLPRCNTPFALLGHSMGALLAFEVARWMRRESSLSPSALFVSGEPAPQLPRPGILLELSQHDDRALTAQLGRFGLTRSIMEDEAVMRELLPRLRADLALCATYTYQAEEPFTFPISAFAGQTDPLATKSEVMAWAEQTSDEFSLRVLPGDHSFVRSQWKAICARLRRDIEGPVTFDEPVRIAEHDDTGDRAPLSRPAA